MKSSGLFALLSVVVNLWILPSAFAAGLHLAAPPAHPFQDKVLYFVLVDRFANGDPSNDTGNFAPGAGAHVHGFNPTDMRFYHGGDLAGLQARLDYLQEMGVNGIWVAPIFRNKPVQGGSAAFHGYWITDFLNVDPHFGTMQELEALVADMGSRGMGLFLDIVANHTADVIQYQENRYDYRPLVSNPYTPVVPAAEAIVKNPAWLNDPVHYHNRGNSTFAGESSVYGDFFGLDDLDTRHPQVISGLIEVFTEWIRRLPIAGYRIDTVKHVHVDFWRAFAPAIREAAIQYGREGFFQFGEVWTGDARILSEFSTYGGIDATLDFGFAYAVRDYISRGRDAQGFHGFFDGDDWYTDAHRNAALQPIFIENHDGGMGRWTWFVRQDNPGISEANQIRMYHLAHALMFLCRGVPVLYYGSEQGFAGGGDPDARARETMFPSQVSAYNAVNLLGTGATTADDNFDQTHPLYQAIGDLARLYHGHPALRRGAQLRRITSDANLFAISRIDRSELIEYVVAFNNHRTQSRSAIITTASPNTRFELIYDLDRGGSVPAGEFLHADGMGQLSFYLPPLSFAVLRAEAKLPARDQAPGIAFTQLADGDWLGFAPVTVDWQRFPGRAEVSVELTSADHAEVTFTVARSGSPGHWELIGVDSEPPYRVFYRLPDDMAPDESFSFNATVNDLRGNARAVTVRDIRPVAIDAATVHLHLPDGNFTGWQVRFTGPGLAGGSETQLRPFIGETSAHSRFAFVGINSPADHYSFNVLRPDGTSLFERDLPVLPARMPQVHVNPQRAGYFASAAAANERVIIHVKGEGDSAAQRADVFQIDHSGQAIFSVLDIPPSSQSDYGAVFLLDVNTLGESVHWGQPLLVQVHTPSVQGFEFVADIRYADELWVDRASGQVFLSRAQADNVAVIHYHRPNGDYGNLSSANFAEFWGMHIWDGAAIPNGAWTRPHRALATSPFGLQFTVPLVQGAPSLSYIIHRGDAKDPGPDQFLDIAYYGYEVWQAAGADPQAPYVFTRHGVGYRGDFASTDDGPLVLSTELSLGGVFGFRSLPGRTHVVEQSFDLIRWTQVGERIIGTGEEFRLDLGLPLARSWFIRTRVLD